MEDEGKKYRQFLAGTISNIISFVIGTALAWTSPSIPKLSSENMGINPLGRVATATEIAWISSLVPLGALISPFAAGPLTSFVGRKWTLLSSPIFFLAAFIMLGVGQTIAIVFTGRILQGFGVGIAMTALPIYIGEISTDSVRGALGSFMQLFIVLGILFVYAVGPYVSYSALNYICSAFPVLFAATYFFMPDSPNYYLSKGNQIAANKSLKYLRGKSDEGVEKELAVIQLALDDAAKNKASFKDLFVIKGNLKALIIVAGLLFMQQAVGINVVLFNSQTIFEKTGSSLKAEIATIIIGAVQVISSGLTPLVVERLGRKIILLFSAGGMAITTGLMGLFFYLDHISSPALDKIMWLPVVSLMIYIFVYACGFGPLPWALLGEMFPVNVKSMASTICTFVAWGTGFLFVQYFGAISDALGIHWAFWIFTICGTGAFLFVLFVLFETKGLTLQQIQDRLNHKSS